MSPPGVVVVGGGPAGCAAAVTAARLGASVALVDAGRTGFRIGEGAAPGTQQLIDEVFGAGTEAFEPDGHDRCPSIVAAWGSPRPSVTDHMLNPLGMAWNLDRERFDADLRAAAARLGVEVRSPEKVAASPEASVVIDASGRNARVARLHGAMRRHEDRLLAVWAVWVADENDRSASTYLEATPRGWWYSVLLSARSRLVVHLTDPDLLPADRWSLSRSATELELIGPVLGSSAAPRMRLGPQTVPARSGCLDRVGGPGWLAAGDAAATFDPLSGRGITSALLTGRSAGEAAVSMLDGGEGIERHAEFVDALVAEAEAGRAAAYASETRWAEEVFWARRQASARPAGFEPAASSSGGKRSIH